MTPPLHLCWVAAALAVTCAAATQQVQEEDVGDLHGPRHEDDLPPPPAPVPVPVPIRHEDPAGEGVPVGRAATPECPPPPPFSRELCSAPACLHHHRCPTGRACCFNGCVHTCLFAVESPPVIDWMEDTSSHLPVIDEAARPWVPQRFDDPAFAEGREEVVHLPGGCTISGKQYAELQTFMEAPSIDKCMCEKGEVVCSIKMFKS